MTTRELVARVSTRITLGCGALYVLYQMERNERIRILAYRPALVLGVSPTHLGSGHVVVEIRNTSRMSSDPILSSVAFSDGTSTLRQLLERDTQGRLCIAHEALVTSGVPVPYGQPHELATVCRCDKTPMTEDDLRQTTRVLSKVRIDYKIGGVIAESTIVDACTNVRV